MNPSNVMIVSAPSGSGKSTLVGRLLETVPELVFSISYTTRPPRGQEKNGQDYFFVSREEFERMLERDEFLEWALVFGSHYYGTARRFLEEARAKGYDLLLDIDVQGAAQVKRKVPEAKSVFILPPSRQELEHRLRYRRLDPAEVIDRRLSQAATEIQGYSNYDYILVNDNLERASEQLNAIVLGERWRARRNQGDSQPPDSAVSRWLELANACRQEVVHQKVEPILKTFAAQS